MIQNFVLPYPPSVNSYLKPARNGRGQVKSAEARRYCKDVAISVAAQGVKSFDSKRISVFINVYPPDNRRRDIQNLTKVLFDSLELAGVYDDDSQVDFYNVRRMDKQKSGKVCITIESIDNHWCGKYIAIS